MIRENISQLAPFLACVWSGFALGAAYDLLRIVRGFGGAVTAAVCDVVFGAAAFALTGCALLAADMGRLRLYSLPIAAAAFFAWQFAVSRPIRRAVRRLRSRYHKSGKTDEFSH